MDSPPNITVAEYMAMAPSDAAWARKAVEPYRGMTPAERFRELAILNAMMDALLDGRPPCTVDGERPFWMHWQDPSLGRPR